MHDRNGTQLQRGDIVTVEFFIKDVHPGDDYCNVTLVSTRRREPDGQRETFTGNSAIAVLQRRGTIVRATGAQESYGGTD